MNSRKIRKIGEVFSLLLLTWTVVAQQYSVTGGVNTPLMVADNSRIQVYLVYGIDDVQISYTSSSTSHQWYRYKMREFDNPEMVTSTQSGTTSFITNVEEGYGYYVGEQVNVAMNRFVCVIDYSKYEFNIRSLNIPSNVDQCMSLRFGGDADIQDIFYYTPAGLQEQVRREFELSYETLEWDETLERFSDKQYSRTFNSNPFSTSFPPPLKDTEITLTGDLFARHFGVEKSISMHYQAVAVEVHADTMILSTGSSNMSESGEYELLAPAEIRFIANANFPVASGFRWRFYKIEESGDSTWLSDNPLSDMVYTFNNVGTFFVKLEVSSMGSCSNNEDDVDLRTFKINITNTELIIPNAFSPGTTPGINDIFKVKYKSVRNFQGWIFNRWGNELFYWNDPDQGWDGKYRGKYVAPGAYYYLIEYTGTNGKKQRRKGDINVFRGKTIDTEISTSGE